MTSSSVSAVLFAKDLRTVASFYATALGMKVIASDEHHSRLECHGFELVVHQIPRHIAESITIERPPKWADPNANFFFGNDPEGNQFGVRQDEGHA
jgi:hypothetical protein